MRKTINKATVIGRVYDKSELKLKTVQNKESENFGQPFIGGKLDIATDDAGLNVVTVNFSYVPPVYKKSGKTNNTFIVLRNLIDNGKSVLENGADEATIVSIDGAIEINDFYTDRNGEETLVSAKRVGGSFVNVISKITVPENKRNTFETDMLINGVQHVEADEERNITEDYLIIKGIVFDFRKSMLPVEYIVRSKGGINYFEGLEITSKTPVFTKVWGEIKSQTTITRKEEESAFGEPVVKEFKKVTKEYVVTGTSRPDAVYEIGDEQNGITVDEVKAAKAARELLLAEKKADFEKRKQASVTATATTVASAPAADGGFDF